MKDPIKALGLWAGFLALGNLVILALVFLVQALAPLLSGYVEVPFGAPKPLSEHLQLGLVGLAALFDVLMGAVLVILLVWLVVTAIALAIQALLRVFARQQQVTGA